MTTMSESTYTCRVCREEWGFIPEDYLSAGAYPRECPLCTMPITEMIGEVFRTEGILHVPAMVLKRIKGKMLIALGHRSACCGAPTISALEMGMTYDQSYCTACKNRCDKLK